MYVLYSSLRVSYLPPHCDDLPNQLLESAIIFYKGSCNDTFDEMVQIYGDYKNEIWQGSKSTGLVVVNTSGSITANAKEDVF